MPERGRPAEGVSLTLNMTANKQSVILRFTEGSPGMAKPSDFLTSSVGFAATTLGRVAPLLSLRDIFPVSSGTFTPIGKV